MTREKAKELLDIIKAYSEGKEIEFLDSEGEWTISKNLELILNPSYYRIKSEPKYRPFESAEECFNEMGKHHPFGWLIDIRDNYYNHINRLGKSIDFYNLFKIYTFADGTPFGIKEEE